MNNINKFCSWVYELTIISGIIVLLVAPLHIYFTEHSNILKASEDSVVFATDAHVREGDVLPVYRFNSEWTYKIGDVRVAEVDGNQVMAEYDKKDFVWPLGSHGRVIAQDGKDVAIDLGSDNGIKVGDILNLFSERKAIGKAKVGELEDDKAYATVTSGGEGDLVGATATIYIYATQVAFLGNPFIEWIELFIAVSVVLLWFLHRKQIYQPFNIIKKLFAEKSALPRYRMAFMIAIGLPFIYFISSLLLNLGKDYGPVFRFRSINWNSPVLFGVCFVLFMVAYYGYLFYNRKSPILYFASLFKYKAPNWEKVPTPVKRFTLWSMHLVVAYIFAATLTSFLFGNLRMALSIAWPESSVGAGASWGELIRAYTNVSISTAHPGSIERFYKFISYFVYSFAIVCCLVGYGHSVFIDPFKGKIRNIDFTFAGWVTTGICYGYFMSNAFMSTVPSRFGLDPAIADGVLLDIIPLLGLLMNVVYTITLFNMGVMFGVMTDKGVMSNGFYSVVRHPSYTIESLMFFILMINGFSSPLNWIGGAHIIFYYFMRSEREDHFMNASNPEFTEYKKKVKYKYIPGIY